MNLEKLFSSKKLFLLALTIIVGTGSSLLLILANHQEPVLVESNITSTFELVEEDAVAVIEEQSAEEEEEVDESPREAAVVAAEPEVAAVETSSPTVLSCSDCTLAPVDKQNSLPSSYIPAVIPTGLAGGGSLVPEAQSALLNLFAAASASGTELEIISSYRSYATQQDTFNYWVSTEVANGLSQAAAEAEANTYSARAGQSEHQLGTTVDIKCLGCTSFDAVQNQTAYNFIEANAHTYGFVISYPQGQQALTGYTYEPWHIRWIGVDLAGQLNATGYTSGNGNYLAEFLRQL